MDMRDTYENRKIKTHEITKRRAWTKGAVLIDKIDSNKVILKINQFINP